MDARVIERRQHRRVDLPVEVRLRSLDGPSQSAAPLIGSAKDVSLAGVYALFPAPFPFAAGAAVSFEVTIPPEHAKQFPFIRLLGKGWVVRVTPGEEPGQAGAAIAFTGETTALSAIQPY